MDSSSVRKEAKKILDNFAISLGKVKVGSLKKDNSFNNGMRKEGKGKKVDAEPKKKKVVEEDFEEEESPVEEAGDLKINASKSILKVKKGDIISVDNLKLEVDAHFILIEHDSTKEMAIDCFDPKTDKNYQIRYFSDRVENSLEVYRFDEIMYNKVRNVKIVKW